MQTDIHKTPENANLFDSNIEDSSMNNRTLPHRAFQSARSIVLPNSPRDANRAILVSMGLLFLAMVLALLAFIAAAEAAHAKSPYSGKTLYLPLVNSNGTLRTSEAEVDVNEPAPDAGDTSEAICAPDSGAEQLATLMANDSGQQRTVLTCDAILSTVAQAMAEDMAKRGYFSAVNPEGMGPNQLVVNAGYSLPAYYGDKADSNNIASMSAGYTTAEEMWSGQANNSQLLGSREFYAVQTDYGIGHVYDPDSDYGHYWVVITAMQE